MRRRKFALRKTLFLSALFIGAGAGISMYTFANTYKADIAAYEQEREITYPAQYSDKHITENAIVSNPRFRNTVTVESAGLLASVLGFIPRNIQGDKPAQMEKGTWLWTPLLNMTPDYIDSIISGAKNKGIRNIYLSIDSYLDIYALPDGTEKYEMKKKFDEALEKFIAQARENGMTVDAEGGWRNWAEIGHEYKAFAVLEYAIEYNMTHTEKLRGFQYDVEPYLLESYREDKKSVLHRFVALIQGSVIKLGDSDLELSVVIPEFYDGSQKETPKYFYGFRYGYTLDHLLSVLDQRYGSKIIVMAYRNFAEGKNGILDISKNEIDEAARYRTKIIVAEETGDVSPSYITFHNTSHSYFDEQSKIVEKALEGEKSYGGISIHYINTLLALK